MGGYYILEGREVVPVRDMQEWARRFERDNRRVAETKLEGITVSTVFLGLDHWWNAGPPLIFETMIFGGPHDGYCDRYSTWEQAEAGHESAVKVAQQPPADGE